MIKKKRYISGLKLVKARHREGSLALIVDESNEEEYVTACSTLSGAVELINIPKGSTVLILESRSSWTKVLYVDRCCWVYIENLKEL